MNAIFSPLSDRSETGCVRCRVFNAFWKYVLARERMRTERDMGDFGAYRAEIRVQASSATAGNVEVRRPRVVRARTEWNIRVPDGWESVGGGGVGWGGKCNEMDGFEANLKVFGSRREWNAWWRSFMVGVS